MLNYPKLSKKPRAFQRLTGFTLEEYDKIYQTMELKYPEYEKKETKQKR